MGWLQCPCPLPCNKDKGSLSQSVHFPSDSSTSLLSPQRSLPSVPSLSSPSQHRHQPPESTVVSYECSATLKGHSSYLSSLAVAGKFLFSGSSDGEIRAWRREPPCSPENSVGNIVVAGTGAVKALVVLQDKIISAHQDHKIRVWKIDGKNHNSPQNYKCVATLPTINDRLMRYFSAKNYVEVRRHKRSTWVHHVDTVSALALSKDCSLLYSASWDRTFKIWRTSDFRCLESKEKAHDDAINAIAVSHDGLVCTGSADKLIKVWKKMQAGDKEHSLVATLEKHLSAVNALAVSEDGTVLYSGACDRSILVWERNFRSGRDRDHDYEHMSLVGALRGHTKAILCLAVVSDLVLSGSADKTVRVWRRGMEKEYCCLAVLEGHTKPVKCLAASLHNSDFDSNGNVSCCIVYSGSLDLSIKMWRIRVSHI